MPQKYSFRRIWKLQVMLYINDSSTTFIKMEIKCMIQERNLFSYQLLNSSLYHPQICAFISHKVEITKQLSKERRGYHTECWIMLGFPTRYEMTDNLFSWKKNAEGKLKRKEDLLLL
ncbi:hypothetical protein OIU77_031505 [Salix suchowensis]|uniref:Uncharacterized protein n=1 Tax=Salix suchowensis TaxID=1278906 RepID=A0ABQ9BFN1_9ROSI|nr:hypothetical protein OIU77_031505 [Salix suchowensis]